MKIYRSYRHPFSPRLKNEEKCGKFSLPLPQYSIYLLFKDSPPLAPLIFENRKVAAEVELLCVFAISIFHSEAWDEKFPDCL